MPRFKTNTRLAPPDIVGIPILHSLQPHAKLQAITATFWSVYHSLLGKDIVPLLAVRSFRALALSKWDFVFLGVRQILNGPDPASLRA